MGRLSNTQAVVRTLFAFSGNECAFPGCNKKLVNNDGTYIAEICHIEAANDKGQRYNENQSDEDRRSVDNLLILCHEHHKVTDDEKKYTVEVLRQMKRSHEEKFKEKPVIINEEILAEVSLQLKSQIDSLYNLTEKIDLKVDAMDAKLNQLLSQIIQPALDESKFYIAELDSIKELKSQGKVRTVVEMLLRFQERNWEKLNPETRYKLIVNLAMCYLDMHDKEKAASALEELKNILYETPESQALQALGYAISGNEVEFDALFKNALDVARDDINLWIGYIERHRNHKSVAELLLDIPSAIAESVQISFHLGQLMIEAGDKKDGIALLKTTITKFDILDGKLGDTKAIIATYMMRDLINPMKLFYGNYDADEKKCLLEAKKLLTESWDNIKDTELAYCKWYIVMNRGVINKVIEEQEQALSDFQKAYELSKSFLAYKNLFLMYLQLANFPMAEQMLVSPRLDNEFSDEEKFELDTFRSRLLCLQGRFREAIPILSAHLTDDNERRNREIFPVIISLCLENNAIDEAGFYSANLKLRYPELVSSHLFAGYIHVKNGEKEEALQSYDVAVSLLTDSSPPNEIYRLASGYAEINEYEKAAIQFQKIVNRDHYDAFSKGLIHAWYESGNFQEALELAEKLYNDHRHIPFLVEIICNIYQETKQYDKAVGLVEDFLNRGDKQLRNHFLLRGARLYSYKRDWQNVNRLALQVTDIPQLPMDDVFNLAYLLIESGEIEKGIAMAFEARTLFFDKSEAHMKYISISLRVKKEDAELYPTLIAVDCMVVVKAESQVENTFIITDKNAKGESVIRPGDEFAQQLIGKSIGDELIIQKGFGIEYRITIVAIMDIYTYAFRESMNFFQTRFAGKHNIGVFRANPGQPDDQIAQVIKESTLKNRSHEQQAYNFYAQRKATVGLMARLFKLNNVKQWLSIVVSSDMFIMSYSRSELSSIEYAVRTNQTIVIDLTALLTNFLLSPDVNFLNIWKFNYIVSQSTIDELQEFYEELETHIKDGMLTLGYYEGRMAVHSLSSEQVIQQRERILTIITWCKTSATVAVPASLLTVNRKRSKHLSEILGGCFYDSILLAKERNATVLSDDDVLKHILMTEQNSFSFSTYQLAQWLAINKNTTPEIFEKFALDLVLANNIYIPLNADQLWATFERAGFQLRKPFITAAKGLIILLPQFLSHVLGIFFRRLYLEAGLTLTREQTILYVLGEVSNHNDFSTVKALLVQTIAKEFLLLQSYKDEVMSLLEAF